MQEGCIVQYVDLGIQYGMCSYICTFIHFTYAHFVGIKIKGTGMIRSLCTMLCTTGHPQLCPQPYMNVLYCTVHNQQASSGKGMLVLY